MKPATDGSRNGATVRRAGLRLSLTAVLLACAAALSAQTGNAAALWRAGVEQMEQEQPYRAIELFKQAQALNKSYIDPLISLASAYYYLDEYDEALRYVQQAVPLGRENAKLLNINGRILLALGKTADAAAIFKSILAREPYNVDALLGLAEFALSKGDEIDALAQYQKSLQYNPKDRRILLALSLMYESKGDRTKSEQYLLKCLDVWGESPMVQAMAAEYYIRRLLWDQALFHAQTSLALSTANPHALRLLGTIHLRRAEEARDAAARSGEYAAAVAAMDQLIREAPEDPLARYQRGMALLRQGNPTEAITAFEQALALAPDDEVVRIVLEDTAYQTLAPEDKLRSRYAKWHFDQADQYRKKNLGLRAEFHYRRGLYLAPLDNAGRQRYAEYLKSARRDALFLEQLEILSQNGVATTFVKDNLEIYTSLLSDRVGKSWGIDQFLVERDPLAVRQYWIASGQQIEHPLAEEYLERYVQTLLGGSLKLSMRQGASENQPIIPPRRVNNESEAFADARSAKADYYVLVELGGTRDAFQARLSLRLARTGNELRSYGAWRSGNYRVQNAIWQTCDALIKELPLRGRLLKRNLDEGLVNLGADDGLKAGDVLTMVSPGSYVLKGDGLGFVFQQDKKTGSFTVGKTDDMVSSGAIKREGFFDRINLGDVILRDGESQGKNLEPTADFPFLYNKIRSIR